MALPAAILGTTLGKTVQAGAVLGNCFAFDGHSMRQESTLDATGFSKSSIIHWTSTAGCPNNTPSAVSGQLRTKNEWHNITGGQDYICSASDYDFNDNVGEGVATRYAYISPPPTCARDKTYISRAIGANQHSGNWTSFALDSSPAFVHS